MRWVAVSLITLAVPAAGCMPRARMCSARPDCDAKSSCVAGRCQVDKPMVKPAIDSARRIVVRPVDLAYLQRGEGPTDGALPPVFSLGKDSARLLLRFSVSVPKSATIVEAYVVLRRSSSVDDDPAPISLHATRIVGDWGGGSVSWAMKPRETELRLPSTRIEPSGPPLVRLDVRELVRQWGRRDASDQGIAVVAENESRTGTTFALRSVTTERVDGDVEPYLELYVR